jgi:hypothetical protein
MKELSPKRIFGAVRATLSRMRRPVVELGEQEQEIYSEGWQQEAITRAWTEGRQVAAGRDADGNISTVVIGDSQLDD